MAYTAEREVWSGSALPMTLQIAQPVNKLFPGIWDHPVYGCIHGRHIILRLHNHDARISSEHCLEVPSTALLPMPTVLCLRLQDLADRSVCFSKPKISVTITPEVPSPRCFQELEEVVLEHLYSSRSDVS